MITANPWVTIIQILVQDNITRTSFQTYDHGDEFFFAWFHPANKSSLE